MIIPNEDLERQAAPQWCGDCLKPLPGDPSRDYQVVRDGLPLPISKSASTPPEMAAVSARRGVGCVSVGIQGASGGGMVQVQVQMQGVKPGAVSMLTVDE